MMGRMIPSREQCIKACESRDARFDGWFIVGVASTGIYCRPSCPTPVQPKPKNMRFYASAAAAQRAGFRACKRCRPDASPGSPEWNTRADLVGRAMRLIADGAVDREGVPGLARRLAVSDRHLNRLLIAELGAGPLALARAQRAQTARVLIETTAMSFAEVALAAGFTSVRQFNDTIREVFAARPGDLRLARTNGMRPAAGAVTVRLPYRRPYDAGTLLRFLGDRAVRGVEAWDGETFRRALHLPLGRGVVALRPCDGHFDCVLQLDSVADTQAAVQRCRRLLDLDADPVAIADALGADPVIGALVARRPGLRSPGAVDGTEALVRAVVGQQVSVAGARTVLGRVAERLGEPVDDPDGGMSRTFPSAAAIADAPDDALPMPAARRRALRDACRLIATGELQLDAGADRDAVRRGLVDVRGIGPWTAEYVAMRALGDPDAFPATDLGIRQALARLGVGVTPRAVAGAAEAWRPWRAYATLHLWNTLEVTDAAPDDDADADRRDRARRVRPWASGDPSAHRRAARSWSPGQRRSPGTQGDASSARRVLPGRAAGLRPAA
jgi:AraC family transcriptional regulator of adaptative response / DNA-3-methyladenine glycosylase II